MHYSQVFLGNITINYLFQSKISFSAGGNETGHSSIAKKSGTWPPRILG